MRSRLVQALLAGGAVVACSQVYADPVTSTVVIGLDAGTFTTPRTPPVPCPRLPSENSPCARVGTVCEYGSSPDPRCNANVVCAASSLGQSWTERSEGACAARCPADPATIVDGAPCDLAALAGPDAGPISSDDELACATPVGVCACTTGRDGANEHPRRWACARVPPGCPIARPLLGQPCLGSRACDYGACSWKRGMRMICEDDVWQVESASCP